MPDRLRPRAFVGRQPDLAAIERAVDEARAGLPSVLLVSGDAGIGKSTLVAEAAERFGLLVYLGRCMLLDGGMIPLAPVKDLVRQIHRDTPVPAHDLAAATRQTTDWVQGTARSTPIDAGVVFASVLDLASTLATTDAVMVGIEDLHWADTSTWDLFEFLARSLTDERVVLVGTFRDHDATGGALLARRLGELSRLPNVHRLRLAGLDPAEVATRVEALLGEPPTPSLVAEITARGEGNPFFTEELVAAHLAGQPIPELLVDLLSADIGAVDDDARAVIEAIAVVGRGVAHELLAAVTGMDEQTLEYAVKVAVDAQLIVVDVDTATYRFRHALIGEVVYAGLLPAGRLRLHGRVAEVLQARAGDGDQADVVSELALHLDRAGDRAGALVASLAAADAAEAFAPAVALRHLERALALWDVAGTAAGEPCRADRLWQAAELASGTVGNERAAELAREALAAGVPARGLAWGHERLGRYLWTAGHLEASGVEFARATEMLAADGPPEAAAFAGLGQSELMLCHYAEAERWCRKALDAVPTADDDRLTWVMAHRVLGLARAAQGHPEEGVALCRAAVQAAASAQTRSFAGLYLATILVDAGRFQDAIDIATDSITVVDDAGIDRSTAGYITAVSAEALTRLGRFDAAGALLATHTVVGRLPVGAIRLARSRALLAARLGDREAADAHLADAEAHAVDPFHRALLDAAAADVHLLGRDWHRAAAAAERGWLANAPTGALWSARFAMYSVIAAVELCLDARARQQDDDRDATIVRGEARIREAAGAQPADTPVEVDAAAHLAHAEAALTRLTGPDPDAWRRAGDHWEQMADPWSTATTRVAEAEAAVQVGDLARAARALHDAHRLATDLGAPPLAAVIDELATRARLSVEAHSPTALDGRSIDRLGLTAREAEVLALLAVGRTNRQIGETLFVSAKTASVHVSNILRKLGVTSRVDAAAIAQRLGDETGDEAARRL